MNDANITAVFAILTFISIQNVVRFYFYAFFKFSFNMYCLKKIHLKRYFSIYSFIHRNPNIIFRNHQLFRRQKKWLFFVDYSKLQKKTQKKKRMQIKISFKTFHFSELISKKQNDIKNKTSTKKNDIEKKNVVKKNAVQKKNAKMKKLTKKTNNVKKKLTIDIFKKNNTDSAVSTTKIFKKKSKDKSILKIKTNAKKNSIQKNKKIWASNNENV